MAFALALQSIHDLPEGHGQTIFTATTAIVVLTASDGHESYYSFLMWMWLFMLWFSCDCLILSQVLLIGGSTGTMLEALQVVGDGHDSPLGEVSVAKMQILDSWLLGYWISWPLEWVIFWKLMATSIFSCIICTNYFIDQLRSQCKWRQHWLFICSNDGWKVWGGRLTGVWEAESLTAE